MFLKSVCVDKRVLGQAVVDLGQVSRQLFLVSREAAGDTKLTLNLLMESPQFPVYSKDGTKTKMQEEQSQGFLTVKLQVRRLFCLHQIT